jgi:hypothetical protein
LYCHLFQEHEGNGRNPKKRKQPEKKEPVANNWLFETSTEIPTLASPGRCRKRAPKSRSCQGKEIFEFNKTLANQVESLNEKLKEER